MLSTFAFKPLASLEIVSDPTKLSRNNLKSPSLPIPTPPATKHNHASIVDTILPMDNTSKETNDLTVSYSNKTVFDIMSFEDALDYLKSKVGVVRFVHCVARHHVDSKARTNVYDLVMLEKPGHPTSDQIFSRGDRSDRLKQGKYPGRLMQLSLQGIIMVGVLIDYCCVFHVVFVILC